MGVGPTWTPAQDAELRERASVAYGWQEVADPMGRTRASVKGRSRKLGITLDQTKVMERRIASILVAANRPESRRRKSIALLAAWERHPERRLAASIRGKATQTIKRVLQTPLSADDISARRSAAVRAFTQRQFAWLPEAFRGDYHMLVQVKKYPAAEARRMIEADIAKAAVVAVTAKRAFDRSFAGQLDRAARLGVTELPVYQTAEHSFSLTGSTLS